MTEIKTHNEVFRNHVIQLMNENPHACLNTSRNSNTWGSVPSLSVMYFHATLTALLPQVENDIHCVIPTPDGGTICYHIYYPSNKHEWMNRKSDEKLALIIFPSLTSNHVRYQALIRKCNNQHQIAVVVFNRRGLCQLLSNPVFHMFGSDADTELLFASLFKSHPEFSECKIGCLGVSMGGNIITRFLGRYNHRTKGQGELIKNIIGVVTICSPLSSSDIALKKDRGHGLMCKALNDVYITKYINELPRLSDTLLEANFYHHYYYCLSNCENMFQWALLNMKMLGGIPPITPFDQKEQKSSKQIETRKKEEEATNSNSPAPFSFTEKIREIRNTYMHTDVSRQSESQKITIEEFLAMENNQQFWNYCCPELDGMSQIQYLPPSLPYFVIRSQDDPVIQLGNSTIDIVLQHPNSIMLRTKGGLHCFYHSFEDIHLENWAEKISVCFLLKMFTPTHPPLSLHLE
jgi:predicted alpha/beta-fold hydrolase